MFASVILIALSAAGPSNDGLAAVRSVLQRSAGSDSTCRDDILVRRLTALGSDTAPALFALYSGEATQEFLGESTTADWLCSPDRIGQLAFGALVNLPGEPVREFLRLALAARPERELRVSAMAIVGRQASADGLNLLFQWIVESGDELASRSVSGPASEALISILRADVRATPALGKLLAEATPAQQLLVYDSLGRCGRPQAVRLLLERSGQSVELDLAILGGLTRLASEHPWRLSENVAAHLEAVLEHDDARLRAAAARSLGELHESSAIQPLIQSLQDHVPAVVRAARWALGECTGQELESREDWQLWLESERAWWMQVGRDGVEALKAGDSHDLAATLRETLRHPLGRKRMAEALIEALPNMQAGAKVVACATLAQLRARRAVPALVELLFEPDAAVRAAAHAALRGLTGKQFPPEPRIWEEFAFS